MADTKDSGKAAKAPAVAPAPVAPTPAAPKAAAPKVPAPPAAAPASAPALAAPSGERRGGGVLRVLSAPGPKRPATEGSLRVKSDSPVKSVAGAIAYKLREAGSVSCELDAIGAPSINQAVKAAIIARG